MRGLRLTALFLLGLAAAGCDRLPGSGDRRANAPTQPQEQAQQPATAQPGGVPGATPMAERVAVLGFLNKRNSISRDLTLRPGQSVRIRDAIVRLGACETTPPWEFDRLTGAFVQLDVQQPGGGWRRVFSGWLYKESPSLNVVEHPVYDVWPKSCAMTHPEAAESTEREESAPKSRSKAPNSAAPPAPDPEDDRASASIET